MKAKLQEVAAPASLRGGIEELLAVRAKLEDEYRFRRRSVDLVLNLLGFEEVKPVLDGDGAGQAHAIEQLKEAPRKPRAVKRGGSGRGRVKRRVPAAGDADGGVASVRAKVEAVLPSAGEVITSGDIQVLLPSVVRKRILDVLGWLCRRGKLKRVGYGKYEIPKGGGSSAKAGRRKSAVQPRKEEAHEQPAAGRSVRAAAAGDEELPELGSMGNRVIESVMEMPDEFGTGEVFAYLRDRELATEAEIGAPGAVSGPIKALRLAGFLGVKLRFGQDNSYVATEKLKKLKQSRS
jgi:hypothetical protein